MSKSAITRIEGADMQDVQTYEERAADRRNAHDLTLFEMGNHYAGMAQSASDPAEALVFATLALAYEQYKTRRWANA